MLMANRLRQWPPIPILDEDLVREILRRVPVKSLMRFKCVSKLWRSIILDPSFASSYIGGSEGILISQPLSDYYPKYSAAKNFYFINLCDDPNPNSNSKLLTHHGTVVHGGRRRLSSTDIVNGLVCFFEGNYSCLYNVATRECRDLPLSHDPSKFCRYFLGFDAASKLYKLLKICAVYHNEEHYDNLDNNEEHYYNIDRATFVRNINCEVLTLGVDASWRIIDSAPWQITTQSKCFDGIIYWVEDQFKTPVELIAFDLDQEKFEFIPRVRSIGPSGSLRPCGYLIKSGPALALVCHVILGRTRRAFIFPYHDNNNNNNSVPIGDWRSGDGKKFNLPAGWGEGMTIRLPDSEGDSDDDLDYEEFSAHSILPDGRVLILDNKHVYYGLRLPAISYLYHPAEKAFTEFMIIQSQSSSPYQRMGGRISYHKENIISLSCLTMSTGTSAPS